MFTCGSTNKPRRFRHSRDFLHFTKEAGAPGGGVLPKAYSTIYRTRFRTAKNLCELSFFLQQLIVATSQATLWRDELIYRKRWHLLPRKGYVVTTQSSLRKYHHHYNHQNPLPYLEFITFLLSSFAKMFRK